MVIKVVPSASLKASWARFFRGAGGGLEGGKVVKTKVDGCRVVCKVARRAPKERSPGGTLIAAAQSWYLSESFLCRGVETLVLGNIGNKGPVHVPDHLSGRMTECRAITRAWYTLVVP